jgi:CheY-like chemotaxis protein
MNTDNTQVENSEPAAQTAPDMRSVLLVDDNPNFRMIVELNLQRMGYAVLAAGSAEEAIEIATQNNDIQLLITDVAMPGLNGVELAQQIRRIRPLIKVLSISGFPQKVVAGMGVWTDSLHFLQKPFMPAQLDQRIKAIFAGE